ncbi:unnamed protein product [Euphydryas editha]|uniref:Uncharacterized protein n=1 Tax=Euphydryas editha TaxID=104508 RepID=A0AAU9ULK5_EUPED|nr:unnamed protein product [Euphydryas editha]
MKRRREQKKNCIRRARAKMDVAALEERRRKDRERYQRKKQLGEIKSVKDYTPKELRDVKNMERKSEKETG